MVVYPSYFKSWFLTREGYILPMKIDRLLGQWRIHRTITSENGEVLGRMEGIGEFIPDEEGALYREEVAHTTDKGQIFQAKKAYRYSGNKSGLKIYFHGEEQNRLFMTLGKDLQGEMWCKKDHYHQRWEVFGQGHIRMECKVQGPKKKCYDTQRV